jgi:Esterase/lipase
MTPLVLEYPAAQGALSLPLDLWLPDTAPGDWRGLVVYAHGGGFSNGKRRDGFAEPLAERITAEGYALASIDYRLKGTPASEWSERRRALVDFEQARCQRIGLGINPQYCGPWFYMALEDFSDAITFLKSPSCGVDFTGLPVLALGASAGGIAALSLAFRPREWGHLALPDAAVGISAAMVQPWRLGAEPRAPGMLIHGKADKVIDPANIRLVGRKSREKGAPLRVVITETAGHNAQLSVFLNDTDTDGTPWWRVALGMIAPPPAN